MKKSELKKYIKAEIVNELSIGEATIETSPENLDKVKQKADKDDVIRVTEENIGLADLEEMGYEAGEKAFDMHFDISILKNSPDMGAYRKGFIQSIIDKAGSKIFEGYEEQGFESEDEMEDYYLNLDSIDENESLEEMAKIAGDLKSAIEKVMSDNPDLETLPLKKAIKADADVIKALGDDSLYDNQLGKFIAASKGEREIGQRGRKADPNTIKRPKSPTGKVGRPGLSNAEKIQKLKNKDNTKTFSIGKDKKYYSTKKVDGVEADGPTDAELRQLAKSGKKIEKSKEAQLKLQEKSKLVKAFLKDMRDQGIVDTANRIVDKEKYDSAWSITKPEIEAAVKNLK
jgi:hypothetical protein